MFIHRHRLEHLLSPAHYFSREQHELELQRLFLPAWHLLAAKADLPRNGDFLTTEVLGRPVLLRNFQGEARAFLNVCAHRHCLLTHVPRGNDSRFRCQYHGWEYTKEGRTGRIPDAGCFRPFDRENARLKPFRTQSCGDLIFVCMDDRAPGLEEYLGPYHAFGAKSFAGKFRQAWTYDASYNCNWKVLIENSLESYHLPCLHQKTLCEFPSEEECEHELTDRFTSFRTRDSSRSGRFLAWYMRRWGMPSTMTYEHHHLHPHMTFVGMDVFRLVQIVLPTSPTACRHMAWLFTARGERPDWIRQALGWSLARIVTAVTRRVVLEDVAIYGDAQRGLEASATTGVLGAREERVFAFQRYVRDHCG
jgi:phenylpropionate dioxygenase-like ring-hydroxylating dioxygenase large terminal subunit